MPEFIKYIHHGMLVAVDSNNIGKHRENCLCYSCRKFNPGDEDNCMIANVVYANCVVHGLVTPVWECPQFDEE